MIEFAIVALLLFTLLFGIIEFGWIFNGYVTLTSAAREGARQAIVIEHEFDNDEGNEDEASIKEIIDNHAVLFDLSSANIEVYFGNYEEETTVEIIDFRVPNLVGFLPIPESVYTITATASMRQER